MDPFSIVVELIAVFVVSGVGWLTALRVGIWTIKAIRMLQR